MKKLITGVIVAAALAVPATPAFAIHHQFIPHVIACATSGNALGVPAFNNGLPPNALGVSNDVLPGAAGAHAQAASNCHNN